MTNLEAIQAKVTYPLPTNSFILALTDNGLVSTDTYSVANKKALELCQADLCLVLVTQPNITEGGYQVSINDKKVLTDMANKICSKYDLPSPFGATATFKQIW